MRTIQEVENDIQSMQAALNDPAVQADPGLRQTIQDGLVIAQAELQALQAGQAAAPSAPIPAPPVAPTPPTAPASQPQTTGVPTMAMQQIMSILTQIMSSGAGSGVDSAEVRAIIKQYLGQDKVLLGELDQSVLDEIRKNQMVMLQIPNFSKPIQVTKDTAEIPNIYEIIDDVLAGNNVFLIGEAGAGKTYTAKEVAKILQREIVTINCSQYTAPGEILGGQTIEGFVEGKLITAWRDGKLLLLDEMPKLDPNTAGLFNDALALSSHTRTGPDATISSANPKDPQFPRNDNFACIATGNLYPNRKPDEQYGGNNRQDLSLLDRFSGSVYFTDFDKRTDEKTCRFQFLYDMLVGNYYEWVADKKLDPAQQRGIIATGLRTIITEENYTNLALVSYRTIISMRVAFEYELVREIARREGKNVQPAGQGKTLAKAFESWMVAFKANQSAYDNIIRRTSLTPGRISQLVQSAIDQIVVNDDFMGSLTQNVRQSAAPYYQAYQNFYVANVTIPPGVNGATTPNLSNP